MNEKNLASSIIEIKSIMTSSKWMTKASLHLLFFYFFYIIANNIMRLKYIFIFCTKVQPSHWIQLNCNDANLPLIFVIKDNSIQVFIESYTKSYEKVMSVWWITIPLKRCRYFVYLRIWFWNDIFTFHSITTCYLLLEFTVHLHEYIFVKIKYRNISNCNYFRLKHSHIWFKINIFPRVLTKLIFGIVMGKINDFYRKFFLQISSNYLHKRGYLRYNSFF